MGRKSFERISQREYAKRIGVSNNSVSLAVKEGRIVKGWDKRDQKIIVEYANQEWGALHMKTNVNKLIEYHGTDIQNAHQMQAKETPGKPGRSEDLTLTGRSTYAEAKRVREIFGAQIAGLELAEKNEQLVQKEIVYKQLFAFGQQMRSSVLSIPDRIIDAIVASRNRSEAHQLLTGELHAALEQLTKTDFTFVERN